MKGIVLTIDEKEVVARPGMTILEAAKRARITIPTLCHHGRLKPYGACRLCGVELEASGCTKLVMSCLYPVEEGLVIRTRSKRIDRVRRTVLELQLAHAPEAWAYQDYVQEYGADKDRFEKEASFCIQCGFCVRYCDEVRKKNAVGFIGRGARREISFMPEIASRECRNCEECSPLCPTVALRAAFVLTEALAFPTIQNQRVQSLLEWRDAAPS